ncbi:hypothetical protein NI456_01605 [Brevundimonas diminuta]|uniref:hypothetical protein n=1 Tax=Brevundimonas diminuta TaxID=293 RepID=UPI0020980F61|nr:hypothetical protein [Brevundimonas diminuta]MCO8017545.1 hypothetical protein [Brevundimonas diminuta]MCO8021065.1 hypothetical protein [Brevundimonas diminuta]
MTDTPRVTVPVEWHREDADHCRLIYSLMQKGWRKGQPVMVNDVAIRIEACNGSETDIGPIADTIQAALSAAPAPDGGAVDESRLKSVVSMLERVAGPTASVRIYEHEAKLILAALATREEALALENPEEPSAPENARDWPSEEAPADHVSDARQMVEASAGAEGDVLTTMRDHYTFALKGPWPGVATPHYALAGLFQMAGDEIEALRAQPQAREDAGLTVHLVSDGGDIFRIKKWENHGLREGSHRLHTHPAPDALREALSRAEYVLTSVQRESSDSWLVHDAGVALESLAALQAEQKGGAA